MEDIIEKLRANAQDVPVPLDLPDEDQLLDIEEALLTPLPKSLRAFLLTVSDLVIGSLEPATAADPHAHTYLADMAADAWERGLPRHLLPFCQSGSLYYCINLEDAVVVWSPASGESDAEWEDIWHWAEAVWLPSGQRA
ncbi:MAG TPA: SMI1/KNR4 family protein [Cellvibrionaceae bacterium]|nr:SMI1/KNR4 family protein [Cellvibrionaceae bacterium]HMW70474.1 SMI1/KNR4 family protein [Cellvibrionaceae bacterium]HMY38925.1 SMI1/KNR4 family protein [Marinagarivorans sp.]HNG58626.1 SMI1/KNR4 family protein [Cellvibrionaceae bacterium]